MTRGDRSARSLVLRVVDADSAEDHEVRGAATVVDGALVAWHVTDDPDAVIRAIDRARNFVKSYGQRGARAELGPGLYVSAHPEMWASRSRGKWTFLRTLIPAELDSLIDALEEEVLRDRASRRITDGESSYALRLLDGVSTGATEPSSLVALANPPYAIRFWRADWLDDFGLGHLAPQPVALKVRLFGRYAEMTSSVPDHRLLRTLRRMGLAGAFLRSSMSNIAQLVVWSGDDVEVLDVEDF